MQSPGQRQFGQGRRPRLRLALGRRTHRAPMPDASPGDRHLIPGRASLATLDLLRGRSI